jgi:hypothetical protein
MRSFDDQALDQPFKRALFEKIRRILQKSFRKSRTGQDIIFSQDSHRTTSEVLDGRGGASFLLELLHYLGGGLLQKRELLKTILVIAARSLKIPIRLLPSGIVSVRMYPHFEEPSVARHMNLVLRRGLPLSDELRDLVLAFAGPLWVSHMSTSPRDLGRRPQSFLIETDEPRTRRFLRSVLPFQHSVLDFSEGHQTLIEWTGSAEQTMWVHTSNIWELVNYFRFHRKKNAAHTLRIRGLGTLLV